MDELKQRLRTEWAKLDHVVIAAAIRQCRRGQSRLVMHKIKLNCVIREHALPPPV